MPYTYNGCRTGVPTSRPVQTQGQSIQCILTSHPLSEPVFVENTASQGRSNRMGQYYVAVILGARGLPAEQIRAWASSYDWNCGAKLMEHSWIGSRFVEVVMHHLGPTGAAHKSRVVWAGDYADEERDGPASGSASESAPGPLAGPADASATLSAEAAALTATEAAAEAAALVATEAAALTSTQAVAAAVMEAVASEGADAGTAGSEAGGEVGERNAPTNLYDRAMNAKVAMRICAMNKRDVISYRYLVNHDMQQYVDKDKAGDIHPLPLLTAEGDREGGDYRGSNEELVGIWARNILSAENEVPPGFAELEVCFEED
jgi:hypothetical protein